MRILDIKQKTRGDSNIIMETLIQKFYIAYTQYRCNFVTLSDWECKALCQQSREPLLV